MRFSLVLQQGLFIVETVYSNGVYRLINQEGD